MFERWDQRATAAEAALQQGARGAAAHLSKLVTDQRGEIERFVTEETTSATQLITASVAEQKAELERIAQERAEQLAGLVTRKFDEAERAADGRRSELQSLSNTMEDQVTAILGLAHETDERVERRLGEVEAQLETARSQLGSIVDEQRGALRAEADRSTEDLEDKFTKREQTLERVVGDRLAALEFAVDEGRKSLEAARTAESAELEKVTRSRGAELERLVDRIQEVEEAVARRLGELERRAVERGAALEDLLGRVGELARATSEFGRESDADQRRDDDRGAPFDAELPGPRTRQRR
jgi:hypothetical protein